MALNGISAKGITQYPFYLSRIGARVEVSVLFVGSMTLSAPAREERKLKNGFGIADHHGSRRNPQMGGKQRR
ncbi:hypothetical protein ARTHRO9V_280234 [Arthrobacter sp. 9V]|nr:hypothetical protein ARTHRO9V_280234 [Arthrobacter sp. 9V]